jgi:diguanylate cyclase (GGDEF)-like protein
LDNACCGNTGLLVDDPAFYREILYHMTDGVYFVDRQRRILYWNGGAAKLTGYHPSEMVGRLCYDNILAHVNGCGTPLCDGMCPLSVAMENGEPQEASVFLRHRCGHRVPVLVRVQPIRGLSGEIEGAVETFSNNSAQVEAERRVNDMKRMAFIDHLTELPNRRYLEMILQSAHREFITEGIRFGVVVIDVDRFKEINDTFGHRFGDSVLCEIGKTLTSCIRSKDVLGRWGGDEFVAVIRGTTEEELQSIAERCSALVNRSEIMRESGKRLPVSISAGAAMVRECETAEELFARADQLMYQSKISSRHGATLARSR